jgi:hypothetical protein
MEGEYMEALVPTNLLCLAPLKVVEAPVQPIVAPSSLRLVDAALAHDPRAFPIASTSPALPVTIRDETLEFYAFVFCQGGFRQLGMTFEQLLLVAAAIKPADFPAARQA